MDSFYTVPQYNGGLSRAEPTAGRTRAQAHPDAGQYARSTGLAAHRHGLSQRALVLLPALHRSTPDGARRESCRNIGSCLRGRGLGQDLESRSGHVAFARDLPRHLNGLRTGVALTRQLESGGRHLLFLSGGVNRGGVVLLPESPGWLLSRGNVQEAEASMRYTRNITRGESLPDNLQQELDAMMLSSTRLDSSSNWKDKLSFLKRPEAYKPPLIINVFFFFQHASGIFVVISYTVTIVMETGVQVDSYLVTVLIGVLRLVMSIVISYASKRYGRRLLCNISGAGMALSVGALALFLCLMHNDVIGPVTAAAYGWVPITALLLFVFTGSLGFLPLPFAMLGEIFPAKIRGWSCGFSTFMATIFSFVAIKIFPMMRNLMGFHNVFTFYAATIAIGTIIMYFWLPETRGKTLEEIEEFFRSGEKAAVRDKAREIMMPELAELENTSVENERLSMRGCRAANGEKATEKLISGPQCPEESMMNKN